DLVRWAWDSGGDVWLSRRLLAEAPPPEGAWVEGDDARVSWAEIRRFFSNLDVGQAVGGEDGFVRPLPPARTNPAPRPPHAPPPRLRISHRRNRPGARCFASSPTGRATIGASGCASAPVRGSDSPRVRRRARPPLPPRGRRDPSW